MNKNDIAYYLPNHDGRCPYLDDLRDGKLRIYEVPRKYRVNAYIETIRRAINQYSRDQDDTEKKLLEHLLFSDIQRAYRDGNTSDADYLRSLHNTYFRGDWPTLTWSHCYPYCWRRLDLSSKESEPPRCEPLVLHFEQIRTSPPVRGRKKPCGPREYETGSYHRDGMFVLGELWPKDPGCVLDLKKLQARYDICWCQLPPLDAPRLPEMGRQEDSAGQR